MIFEILLLTGFQISQSKGSFAPEEDFILPLFANIKDTINKIKLNRIQQLPKLFHGCHIYLQNPFTGGDKYPPKAEISKILQVII